VEIRIRRSGEVDAELSQSLAEHFDLQNAVVVRTYSGTPEGVVKAVAQAAASFLRDNLVPYTSVGVAYGRTLHSVLEYPPPPGPPWDTGCADDGWLRWEAVEDGGH